MMMTVLLVFLVADFVRGYHGLRVEQYIYMYPSQRMSAIASGGYLSLLIDV